MKKLILALCSLTMTLTLSAHADNSKGNKINTPYLEGLTIGALATFGSDGYAVDDKVGAAPLILYDNDYFYAEGLEAGLYPYKDDHHWFRTGISYDFRHFEPDDATVSALKGLDERKPSANITLSYMYITPVGGFEVKANADMMDNSGGQSVSLAHRSRFKLMDDKLTLYPKFGVSWYSEDYNQYYFGISETESAKTGLNTYKAKSSYSPFVSMTGRYQFTEHIGAFANAKVEWLSSVQKDSPLTDDDVDIGANAGLTYTF